MKALVGAAVVGVAVSVLLLAALADAGAPDVMPSPDALAAVPASYLVVDRAAATTCPGLSWTLLAAIAQVESDFGRSGLAGVAAGSNFAGAEGPMQFEPATFAAYDHPVAADEAPTPIGVGVDSPYDPAAATYAAARMLCADGVGADPASAVYAYNHSAAYVSELLGLADRFGQVQPGTPSPAGASAADWAQAQVGRPYVWGGADPEVGFDCSGLVLWAYAQAGVVLPRTAQAQYDAGPVLAQGAPLEAGDLVFFGTDPAHVTHVGIYVGAGLMVDAPHPGAAVRVEGYRWSDYLGATAPGGQP